MPEKNIGQQVECDQCTWDGYENDLETVNEGNNVFNACPECGEVSISYMDHE